MPPSRDRARCRDVVVGLALECRGDKAFGDRVAALRHQRGEIGSGDGGDDAVLRALGDGIYKALRGFGPPSIAPVLSDKIASPLRLLDSRGAALYYEIND